MEFRCYTQNRNDKDYHFEVIASSTAERRSPSVYLLVWANGLRLAHVANAAHVAYAAHVAHVAEQQIPRAERVDPILFVFFVCHYQSGLTVCVCAFPTTMLSAPPWFEQIIARIRHSLASRLAFVCFRRNKGMAQ